MRLINLKTRKLETFLEGQAPPYAILSHTWGPDCEEIGFDDIEAGNVQKQGVGSIKLDGCCKQAGEDGLGYVWIDTCCINKSNHVELAEAINSMFRWYGAAVKCYVFMADVPKGDDPWIPGSTFIRSRWFTRGWTLQELVAPKYLDFYDSEWTRLGSKRDMAPLLQQITGIPHEILTGWDDIHQASIAQRMSWAANRETKRKEDVAYCLLGIFGVVMPMIYGEGDQAFIRLQEEIIRRTRDDSILAWGLNTTERRATGDSQYVAGEVLATSPSDFAGCGNIVCRRKKGSEPDSLVLLGTFLRIQYPTVSAEGLIFAMLDCHPEDRPEEAVGVPLHLDTSSGSSNQYLRPIGRPSAVLQRDPHHNQLHRIDIRREIRKVTTLRSSKIRDFGFVVQNGIGPGLELVEVSPVSRWDRDNGVISTVAHTSELVGGFEQRTWTRFRTRQEASDLVVLLELKVHGEDPEANCYPMLCGPGASLETISEVYDKVTRPAGSTVANGSLRMRVGVTLKILSRRPMFVFRLEPDPRVDTVDSSLQQPLTMVDIGTEASQLEVEQRLRKLLEDDYTLQKEEDVVSPEIESASHRRQERMEALSEVRETIKLLQQEEQVLQREVVKLDQEIAAASEKHRSVRSRRSVLIKAAHYAQEKWESLDATRLPGCARRSWEGAMVKSLSLIDGSLSANIPLEAAELNENLNDLGRLVLQGVIRGREGFVKFMLDIPAWDGKQIEALLWCAVTSGHRGIVELFLDIGGNPRARGKSGRTLLHAMADSKLFHKSVATLLINRGAKVDEKDDNGDTALMVFSRVGDYNAVEFLLHRGAGPRIINKSHGHSPLLGAVLFDHSSIVQLLLDNGASMNDADRDGDTALLLATRLGHEFTVRILLAAGAEVNRGNKNGKTPLMVAAESHGDGVLLLLLLDNGAFIDDKDSYGNSPAFLAAASGLEENLTLLVNRGLPLEETDKDGDTILQVAVKRGLAKAVSLLVLNGAKVDSMDGSRDPPLHLAARLGDAAIVRLLLEHGIPVDARGREGETSMMLAASRGHCDVVQALLDAGASVDKTAEGLVPLVLAAEDGHLGVVNLLLENGANINATDPYTPLMYASSRGQAEIVEALCYHGAKPNDHHVGHPGHTALSMAIAAGHYDAVAVLIHYGADIHALDAEGTPPLLWAARLGLDRIVQLLLAKGASVTSRDKNGCTCLMRAAFGGHEAVVRLLLNKDPDGLFKSARDCRGRSTLHHAVLGGHLSIATLLCDALCDARTAAAHATGASQIRTAWQLAVDRGNPDIAEMLQSRGGLVSPAVQAPDKGQGEQQSSSESPRPNSTGGEVIGKRPKSELNIKDIMRRFHATS